MHEDQDHESPPVMPQADPPGRTAIAILASLDQVAVGILALDNAPPERTLAQWLRPLLLHLRPATAGLEIPDVITRLGRLAGVTLGGLET